MTKKTVTKEIQTTQNAKSPNVRTFERTPEIDAFANELGLDLDLVPDSLLDRAIDKTNSALRLIVEAGLDYIALKAATSHGEFIAALEARGASKQRAHEAMSLAVVASHLSDKDRKSLLSMSKSKASIIARADQPVIEQLMLEIGSDELSDLDDLTVIDLKQKIKKLEKANHNLNADLETAKESRDHLKGILAATDPDKQPFLIETRQEFAALSDKGMLAIESMEQLVGALERLSPLDNSPSDFTDQRDIAINTACVHVSALFARAQQLVQRLGNVFGDSRINPALVDHADLKYGESELALALENRQLIYAEHKEEAYAREANRPRGVGRPKNKK